jgi:hypothetical protein
VVGAQCECFNPQMHTGSQMQAIATATAKADIKMEGKKYGNLQEELCFDNHNQHKKNKVGRNTKLLKFCQTRNKIKIHLLIRKGIPWKYIWIFLYWLKSKISQTISKASDKGFVFKTN